MLHADLDGFSITVQVLPSRQCRAFSKAQNAIFQTPKSQGFQAEPQHLVHLPMLPHIQ